MTDVVLIYLYRYDKSRAHFLTMVLNPTPEGVREAIKDELEARNARPEDVIFAIDQKTGDALTYRVETAYVITEVQDEG